VTRGEQEILYRHATAQGMSRRRFIAIAAAASGGAAVATVGGLGLAGLLGTGQPGVLLTTGRDLPTRFRARLPIPPVARPTRTDATTDYYEITQRISPLRIFDDVMTPAWTYGSSFPGPTIMSTAGRRTVITHRNELPHPVAVHLHGGHTPHDSDGYPTDLILPTGVTSSPPAMDGMDMPGTVVTGQRDYTYPLNQRAATLWYHDHRMGFTGPAVWYGLAGFHLVHDDEETALPLPTGERDIPLMIVDRAFDAAGRLAYPSTDPTLVSPGVRSKYRDGVLGDVILVNGAPWPVLDVDRARYRFRILNASNARRYRLVLDPPAPITQIGSDGGLLDAPLGHEAIEIASAERYDVVIDFSAYTAGTQVTLRNTLGSGSTADVMRFVVGSSASDSSSIPARLSSFPRADASTATVIRDFLFQSAPGGGWTINGEQYRAGHPLATPTLGRPEVWRFTTDVHHPVHLHLDQFRVLKRGNASDIGDYDHGYKDTLDLRPAESATVLVTFADYAGQYVFHCHNLEHEDMAMMADFTTV
jgi:FtsP/CotA-like multicopper oxidase with cupredoxin domain